LQIRKVANLSEDLADELLDYKKKLQLGKEMLDQNLILQN
jgi:hypothetical protein